MFRSRISLDGEWEFWTDPDASLSISSLGARPSSAVAVPAPWQSQAPELRHYFGTAWYRRALHIPADWLEGRCLVIGFGAVDYLAEVWLNGVKVGEHEGGYLPFEFDVTHAARAGINTLIVRVADPLDLFREIPHGKQSWYGPLSGLWQSVWLESRPTHHIVRARITPHPAEERVDVAVTLNRPITLGPRSPLAFEILSPDGQVCARADSHAPTISIPLLNPLVWDIDSPNLYSLRVTLNSNSDSLTSAFGFRTIETRDGHILLNGRPLYLRGALDQDYYPDLICTPPSLEYIENEFRKAKLMGLNCLRLHLKVGDPRYYAAADKLGLLIWTELPNWILLTDDAKRRARQTLAGMVERDGHHPSIIIWTIINESWGLDLTNPEHRVWLSETYDYLKALDPHRLVVGNSACQGNFHVVTDIEDFHFYTAIPDHFAQWRDWVASFASRPSWTFAHTYKHADAPREFLRNMWDSKPRPLAPEVRRRGDEPLVVSEFGNWGLPDVGQLIAGYGGREPWWFETGHEWGDGVVYPHGVEERFRTFHLDRVFPSLSELAAASQRLQFSALKYEIEQIRRHPEIAGYVLTEFADVHWECNGLLDMLRNPKGFYDVIGHINSDDLIVPEWKRLAFWEGERCEVELLISHFSRADLNECRLEWHLEQWPDIRGVFAGHAPPPVSVTRIGSVEFVVPAVKSGSRARLELGLFTRDGTLAARNDQELYFFPRRVARPGPVKVYAPTLTAPLRALGYTLAGSLATGDIAVVETLTDDLRAYLLSGGHVLWLADSEEALQANLDGLEVVPRRGTVWQGDWASSMSWLCQDRMFDEIPTGGLIDFAFAGLTPEHVIRGLRPHDFATDVHAGLFVGWLHKTVALVAEQRSGRGRLLISTFRLRDGLQSHPVAAIMLHDMLAHLSKRR